MGVGKPFAGRVRRLVTCYNRQRMIRLSSLAPECAE
jgi:hypothetical protein